MWGSKRTGPDLHRIGGKYSDIWHELHLVDPRSVVPESIMPGYPWLVERPASGLGDIQAKMRVLQKLGHPYSEEEIAAAPQQLDGLREMDALIVYLQMLGSFYDPDAPAEGHGDEQEEQH
jgi:cytochrome c oxidase cbb3-type subunit II